MISYCDKCTTMLTWGNTKHYGDDIFSEEYANDLKALCDECYKF